MAERLCERIGDQPHAQTEPPDRLGGCRIFGDFIAERLDAAGLVEQLASRQSIVFP
jgi:hypothetical protein